VPLGATKTTYAFLRDAGDGMPVLALFSRAPETLSIPLGAAGIPAGTYVDVPTGETSHIDDGSTIPVQPLGLKVLTPASNPCLQDYDQ
jgi:hypothetical protein